VKRLNPARKQIAPGKKFRDPFTGTKHTYMHDTFYGLLDFVRDYPGEPAPEPIWILLKQETLSGSGISWDICKSAPRSRQITMPASHHSVSTGRMPFLQPNQQRQSTEGTKIRL